MTLPFYQVDAFTRTRFTGNPAAVCLIDGAWPADDLLQAIAAENNLPETAFVLRTDNPVHGLRWFTPTIEMDLCGHATLASAHVLMRELGQAGPCRFDTRSGILTVEDAADGEMSMDLPANPARTVVFPDVLDRILRVRPLEVAQAKGGITVVVVDSPRTVAEARVNLAALKTSGISMMILTAPAGGPDSEDGCDIASRVFAPAEGIDEDPVTGAAHCVLSPFWGARLKTDTLVARQLSARGGMMTCTLNGDRVTMQGSAVTVIRGTFDAP